MQQYIQGLLPRLKQISKNLDHVENFVDKPWVHIDNERGRLLYIFKRDQTLLLSVNGRVTTGSWEYIQPANSLLISHTGEQYLLNHAFVSNGLMVLKLDGTQNLWVMINEHVIPDLDVERYLQDFVNQGTNAPSDKYLLDVQIQTHKGAILVKARQGILTRELPVLNAQTFPDGTYDVINNEEYKAVEIQNGRISRLVHKSQSSEVILFFVGLVLVVLLILAVVGLRH